MNTLRKSFEITQHIRRRLVASLSRGGLLALVATVGLAGGTVAAAAASRGHSAKRHGAWQRTSRLHVTGTKPTVVLVHGAFADSSSFTDEAEALTSLGYPVINVADPLRSLPSDAAYVSSVVASVQGPVVLVGHSYAGMIVSQVAAEEPNVKALVYLAALIPQVGESTNALVGKFPGSGLVPSNLIVRSIPGGGADLYIKPGSFESVYGNGLSPQDLAAATVDQRPVTAQALEDPATAAAPEATPKWEIVALQDHAVPTALQFWMAQRAHAKVVTVSGGHDVQAGHPKEVTQTILDAASAAG